jgi:hypothetical protein
MGCESERHLGVRAACAMRVCPLCARPWGIPGGGQPMGMRVGDLCRPSSKRLASSVLLSAKPNNHQTVAFSTLPSTHKSHLPAPALRVQTL